MSLSGREKEDIAKEVAATFKLADTQAVKIVRRSTGRARVRGHLSLFQWSNPSLKDHLALFTHGVIGPWSIPKETGRDYIDQMTAEVREEREDSRGRIKVLWVQKRRNNHYLDCELMIDVAAIVSGFLKAAQGGVGQERESAA